LLISNSTKIITQKLPCVQQKRYKLILKRFLLKRLHDCEARCGACTSKPESEPTFIVAAPTPVPIKGEVNLDEKT
jgi:hypothetical protein